MKNKNHLLFILFTVLFSSVVTWWFGISVGHYLYIINGFKMLLIAGTGWFIQIIIAVMFLKNEKIAYLTHLSINMIIGVLLLIPGIILSSLTGYQFVLIPIVSVCISSSVMLWQHIKRVKNIGISQWYTVSWFFSLQLTAAFWVYEFI
jgi:hypothetical protein